MLQRIGRPIAAFVLAFAAIALTWAFLWPTQYGGQASWLVVEGSQLEPFYAEGDLVIAREVDAYATESLVVVAAADGPTLVVEADDAEQILGAPWLHVAGLGAVLAAVAGIILSWPFLLALAAAIGIAVLARWRSPRPTQAPAVHDTPAATREDHVLAS